MWAIGAWNTVDEKVYDALDDTNVVDLPMADESTVIDLDFNCNWFGGATFSKICLL